MCFQIIVLVFFFWQVSRLFSVVWLYNQSMQNFRTLQVAAIFLSAWEYNLLLPRKHLKHPWQISNFYQEVMDTRVLVIQIIKSTTISNRNAWKPCCFMQTGYPKDRTECESIFRKKHQGQPYLLYFITQTSHKQHAWKEKINPTPLSVLRLQKRTSHWSNSGEVT